MYQVTLINGEEETVINAVSTDIEVPRLLNGNIKYGINTIDSFNFNITPNNPGYSKIKALTTLVEVLNTKTNEVEFKGRILLPVERMDTSGQLLKTVTCESELGYLMDSSTMYGEYHDISVRDFLQVIIDNHNSQVSEEKQFQVGNVTVIDNNDSLYRFLGYTKTLDAIKEKLIDRLGGEIQIRYEDRIRFLDYLTSIGELKQTEIRLSKNLKTIEQEKDPTTIISRLIPLGTKLEDSEARLTIESVNNGVKHIDDTEAIAEFGIIVDTVTYDDVTEASNLLSKGQSYLSTNNKIRKKHKITALDLSIIGLDINGFEVGNTYRVVNPLMSIDEDLRVVEKIIDIFNPQNSSLTVGDKFEDIKTYQLGIATAKKNIQTLNENLNTTINVVNEVNTNLNGTIQVVGDISDNVAVIESEIEKLKGSTFLMPEPSTVEVDSVILQELLNKAINSNEEIKIIFPKGIYELYPSYIFSNTRIEMCKGTVLIHKNKNILDPEQGVEVSQTSIFYNARPFNDEDKNIIGYNGNSNITIIGGEIRTGCITMLHGQDIEFKSVTIRDTKYSHAFQIGGCKNVLFDRCKFIGHGPQAADRQYVELIQIDWVTHTGIPGWTSDSAIYDSTVNDGVIMRDCTFEASDTEGYGQLYTAIGTHSSDGTNRNKNITIDNCIIKDCTYAPITANRMIGVNAINNTFIDCNATSGTLVNVNRTESFNVSGNKVKNCSASSIVEVSGDETIKSKNGLVANNTSDSSIQEVIVDSTTIENVYTCILTKL